MDSSPFSRLPAELRNNIYELALHQDAELLVSKNKIRYPHLKLRSSKPYRALAFTQTCRDIRLESSALFYKVNTFKFMELANEFEHKLKEFYTTIGHTNTSALSSLVLRTETVQVTDGFIINIGLDKLSPIFESLAKACFTAPTHCGVRARIELFVSKLPPYGTGTLQFFIDLDFRKLEKSWEENVETMKTKAHNMDQRSLLELCRMARQVLDSKMKMLGADTRVER